MELTQTIGNALQIKHIKNMNFQGALLPSLENQIFSISPHQQQNYDPFVFSSIAASEFNSSNYKIRSNFLVGTMISELSRSKLRAWLYEEVARSKLSRQLCALAGTYVDLYLTRGGPVKLKQFNTFGIACLLLANKLTDNVEIQVDSSVFPKKDVIEWEQRLCICLEFRLNPITFVQVVNVLLVSWNKFAEKHGLWSYNIDGNKIHDKKYFDCTKVFQIIDFLALSNFVDMKKLEVWDFLKEYYSSKANYEKQKKEQCLSIEDQVLINFWSNPEEQALLTASFETICAKFESFLVSYQPWLRTLTLEETKQAESWIKSMLSQEIQFTQKTELDQGGDIWSQTFYASWMATKKITAKPQKMTSQRKSSTDTNI